MVKKISVEKGNKISHFFGGNRNPPASFSVPSDRYFLENKTYYQVSNPCHVLKYAAFMHHVSPSSVDVSRDKHKCFLPAKS
jgi:hypothetical protein